MGKTLQKSRESSRQLTGGAFRRPGASFRALAADSDEAAPLFRDDCAAGFRDDLAPC
ncbi:hypothetical protein GOA91_06515, partial [Sinorhizobium meliloti]|nr:hypothetical protein [Sinorhizobium meliloti]MDX0278109.1 hypothetical protein [Sinorhizobium meliloti]